ncbi:MAG: hypothetical protein LBT95_04135, partial [Treponema sp.]|nr:hypothetical protein [Treponema sp.]
PILAVNPKIMSRPGQSIYPLWRNVTIRPDGMTVSGIIGMLKKSYVQYRFNWKKYKCIKNNTLYGN